jgi:hypothetical protein
MKTTLIVVRESARFDDGTEWCPSAGDGNALVDQKARELKLR